MVYVELIGRDQNLVPFPFFCAALYSYLLQLGAVCSNHRLTLMLTHSVHS